MAAATFQMQHYYRAPLTVDTNHAQKYFDDEDSGALEENVLDQSGIDSGLEMSPPMADSRRDSFAVSTTLFSPKTEDWQSSVEMQSVPSNNPFLEQHSNNPFMQHQQPNTFTPQGHGWSMSSSGSATPLQTFDGLPAEFDANSSIFHRPPTVQGQTPFSNPSNQVTLFQQLGHHGNQSIPTSPQKDAWANQAVRRNGPGSPLIRSHNELRRGDGIRKKNARFDIPAERNLSNIDQLISQSTDEQEIKELKQQKRLLRNRQAALDSRQRKKQHTERLEDEKKIYTETLTRYEEDLMDLKTQMQQLLLEKQQYSVCIESLKMEKEEMIRNHTLETGELRKKVSVLTSHVQSLESAAMSNPAQSVPSHSGFPGPFGSMDDLTMESWDNMGFLGDFPMEQAVETKPETQIVSAPKKPEVTLPTDTEKTSQQGGLLFMLFLVGAFVLSSRSTPSIPRVSEDVRAASATLLENVLKDAGVAQAVAGSVEALAPQPSGTWSHPPAPSMAGANPGAMDGVAPSMLGQMADSLAHPSQEQENEQLFSLSAAQYNGVVGSPEYMQNTPPERSTSQGRRNLADALANMRTNKESAAEVYTRTLLWDQIPGDVVRNFAKMVAECNAPGTGGNDDNVER